MLLSVGVLVFKISLKVALCQRHNLNIYTYCIFDPIIFKIFIQATINKLQVSDKHNFRTVPFFNVQCSMYPCAGSL